VVLPISDKYLDYAKKVLEKLESNGCRASIDDRVESLNKKIRQAEMQKIPYMIVVGEKEEESGTITVRKKSGGEMKQVEIPGFLKIFKKVVSLRSIDY
jgi:threonyl-tRNA synthetase